MSSTISMWRMSIKSQYSNIPCGTSVLPVRNLAAKPPILHLARLVRAPPSSTLVSEPPCTAGPIRNPKGMANTEAQAVTNSQQSFSVRNETTMEVEGVRGEWESETEWGGKERETWCDERTCGPLWQMFSRLVIYHGLETEKATYTAAPAQPLQLWIIQMTSYRKKK